ncbi:hypothetical protein OUZ56_009905 [Daphnia magna]|uniref:Uncharacterized protein n=1 Tax=Daphnia magna TaxID=35525 RepID=A0ABR0AH82_9CRUS|nr:hypothetical protein OUZ56_009905 [Daphnia magna]
MPRPVLTETTNMVISQRSVSLIFMWKEDCLSILSFSPEYKSVSKKFAFPFIRFSSEPVTSSS